LAEPWSLEDFGGRAGVAPAAPKTKDINYVRRTINEFLMPFAMLRNLRKSPLADVSAGMVWFGTRRPSSMARLPMRAQEGQRVQGLPDHSRHIPRVGGGHGPDGAWLALPVFQGGGQRTSIRWRM
jgi:hypothetical protein